MHILFYELPCVSRLSFDTEKRKILSQYVPGKKDIAVSSWVLWALEAMPINVFTIFGHSRTAAHLNYINRSCKDILY